MATGVPTGVALGAALHPHQANSVPSRKTEISWLRFSFGSRCFRISVIRAAPFASVVLQWL
jgi:hypothetical protein